MKLLLVLLVSLPCLAQPVDRWKEAQTPADLIRITEDWLRGEDLATLYVHSDYDGSNGSSTGAASRPYTTIAAVDAVMANNDTIVIGGTFRESWTIEHSGVTVRAWTSTEITSAAGASTTAWTVRGDQIASGWSAHGTFTNTYVASTNAPGSKPRGVVIDWDTRVFSDGRHNAYLEEAASAAACDAAPGTWFWNTTELLVNPPAGVTLSEHEVAWCSTGSGIIPEGDNGTISGGTVAIWVDTDPGNGYGIKGSAVSGWTISDIDAIDCGYHHLGCAVGKCQDNWVIDCTATSGNYTCDSYYIMYSSSGDLDNSGFIRCVANLSPLLKYTAAEETEAYTDYIKGPSSVAPDQTAFGSHTGGAEVIANGGILVDSCTVNLLSVASTSYKRQGFSNGQVGSEPADKDDATTYAIRFVDCDMEYDWISLGQGTSSTDFTSSMAFVRCYLNGNTCVDSSISVAATPNTIYVHRVWALFESCVIVGTAPSTLNNGGIIRVRGTTNDRDPLRIKNCSVYAGGSTFAFIVRMNDTVDTVSVHTLWHSANSLVLFANNSTTAGTSYQFTKNWYTSNITTFGRGAAYDTLAEWQAVVDAGGSYSVDFSGEFGSLVTLIPANGSDVAKAKDKTANTEAPSGVNLVPYQGNVGAWQLYGGSLARIGSTTEGSATTALIIGLGL